MTLATMASPLQLGMSSRTPITIIVDRIVILIRTCHTENGLKNPVIKNTKWVIPPPGWNFDATFKIEDEFFYLDTTFEKRHQVWRT